MEIAEETKIANQSEEPEEELSEAEMRRIIWETLREIGDLMAQYTSNVYNYDTILSLDSVSRRDLYFTYLDESIEDTEEIFEVLRQGCIRRDMTEVAMLLDVPAEKLKSLPPHKQEQLLGMYLCEYDENSEEANRQILIRKMRIYAGFRG